MMNMDRFTQKAQEAIVDAQNIVIANEQQEIDVEHLHLALVRQEDGLIGKILNNMDVDVKGYIGDLEEEVKRRPKVVGNVQPYITRRFSEILIKAEDKAKEF